MKTIRPILVLTAALAAGCAGSGGSSRTSDDATLAVPADRYDTTFNAAREVLRERGFILERVDARDGVITTRPKTTAGVVTPWDREQQTLTQEFEDLFERQQRVVRITFEPPVDPSSGPGAADADRTMHVQVTVQRVHLPGRRLEPEAISQTSYSWDPALAARGMQPGYAVAYKGDRLLADRLAGLISDEAQLTPEAPEPSEPAPAEPSSPAEPSPPAEPAPPPPAAESPAPALTPAPEPTPPAAPLSLPPPPAPPPPAANPWVEGKPLKKP